ncbi:hypothetical protein IPJ91_00125 [bacterium]|nr:MAG: hypothetical protein IPJ91_00125 [bacterium]
MKYTITNSSVKIVSINKFANIFSKIENLYPIENFGKIPPEVPESKSK